LAVNGEAAPRAACNRAGNPQGSGFDRGAIPAFTVTFADGSNYPLPDAAVDVDDRLIVLRRDRRLRRSIGSAATLDSPWQ
jgi:hypothetical protein